MRTVGLGLILAACLCSSGGWAKSAQDTIQEQRLDMAGRERMLIQRIVKASCYVLSGVDVEHYAETAIADSATFESTLDGLINGSSELGWVPEGDQTVRSALKNAFVLWEGLRPAALQVANGDFNSVAVRQILDQTDVAVLAMNTAVGEMQKSGPSADGNERVTATINSAGRQRMLTQKMAKEFCFLLNDISKKKQQELLLESVLLFDDTLKALRAATPESEGFSPAPEKAIKQLEQVSQTWSVMQPILLGAIETGQAEHESLAEVVHLSDQLLTEMAAAVQSYVQAASQPLENAAAGAEQF